MQPCIQLARWATKSTARKRLTWIAGFLCAVCLTGTAKSEPPDPAEVEAAYLYNFGKFVTWPPQTGSDSSAFAICTLGKDDFGSALDAIVANESVQGHKIVVRRLSSLVGADTCQILYLSPSEEPRLARDLEAVKEKPVLTVSTLASFLDQGGMIQFLLEKKRVRFAVNLSPAERCHLIFSSELLKVAEYVHGIRAEAKP